MPYCTFVFLTRINFRRGVRSKVNVLANIHIIFTSIVVIFRPSYLKPDKTPTKPTNILKERFSTYLIYKQTYTGRLGHREYPDSPLSL